MDKRKLGVHQRQNRTSTSFGRALLCHVLQLRLWQQFRTSVTKHLKDNEASGYHVSRRCQRSSLYQVDQIPFHDFKSKIKLMSSVQSPKSNTFREENNDGNNRLSEEGCDD